MGTFEFLLFHRDLETSVSYLQNGVGGLIIDLETVGKVDRQLGFDTQINDHSINDIAVIRAQSDGHLLCRLSSPIAPVNEINAVIDAGANELIVPMITSLDQAERIVNLNKGRAKLTLMVETKDAVKVTRELSELSIDRVYVGLNDLRISRKTPSIFSPMLDGLLEEIRTSVKGVEFGFGGLTLPSKGAPIGSKHLFNEMARLGSDFTFLRRSFYRDTFDMKHKAALSCMSDHFEKVKNRDLAQQKLDHIEMKSALEDLLLGIANE